MGYEHNDIAIMGGLRAALEEETPMFERNDIVTVYKMNEAIAEGGGGGGGGDYTTAKATIKNNSAVTFTVSIPNLYDAGEYGVILNPTATINGTGEQVFDVILYKNAGSGYIDTFAFGNTISVSGDAEYDGGHILFTGDFTITYSAS